MPLLLRDARAKRQSWPNVMVERRSAYDPESGLRSGRAMRRYLSSQEAFSCRSRSMLFQTSERSKRVASPPGELLPRAISPCNTNLGLSPRLVVTNRPAVRSRCSDPDVWLYD